MSRLPLLLAPRLFAVVLVIAPALHALPGSVSEPSTSPRSRIGDDGGDRAARSRTASSRAPLSYEAPKYETSKYEVSFQLDAEIRTRRLDADIAARARLEMASSGGSRERLELVRPLEPASKFYRIDPAGPMGDESKTALVVTLPEGSWAALDRARADADRIGRSAHREWQRATGLETPYDGSFAFVVIGAPQGRFIVERDETGRVASIENRLTDRWLGGPFDRFVATWPDSGDDATAGYWFWNDGETEPPGYEPHVYHALDAALRLLRHELPASGRSERHASLAREILDVLVTLAPKSEKRIRPRIDPVRWTGRPDGSASTSPDSVLTVEAAHAPEASRLEAVWRDEGFRLELRVSITPIDGLVDR